jgi:hypothetical protein
MATSYIPTILALTLFSACGSSPPADPPTRALGAVQELNTLDPRTPVPLQPMMAWHQKQNMQAHLVAIQGVTSGLATEDWNAIVEAVAPIGLSPQKQMQCEHMGSGADGFTELALDFHRRADTIAEAAARKDAKAVLTATANTLDACTSCHATFRQDVVDAVTWAERTGGAHSPGGSH